MMSTVKKMSNEELAEKYKGLIGEPLAVKSVTHVNHKPHPFMVGHSHVAHAADRCGGMLGEATLRAIPCAWKNCTTDYEGHTSDRVLFVSLTRHATNADVKAALSPEVGAMMEADGIDGLTFVETPEKYRITK